MTYRWCRGNGNAPVDEDLGKYAGMPGRCEFLLEDGGNLMSHLLDRYDIKYGILQMTPKILYSLLGKIPCKWGIL